MQESFEIEGIDEIRFRLQKFGDKQKRDEYLKVMRAMAKLYKEAYAGALPKSEKDHFRYVGSTTRRTVRRKGKPTGKRREKGKVPPGDKILIKSGNLARSVSTRTVPLRVTKNPAIAILPTSGGDNDGFYRHMVVSKGFKGTKRKGSANVVTKARNKATKSVPDTTQVRKMERFLNKKLRQL